MALFRLGTINFAKSSGKPNLTLTVFRDLTAPTLRYRLVGKGKPAEREPVGQVE